ncbi:hypothetical protein ECG_09156 [Echinococcus granulosus]|nr:hypothetical protein ECG_09156 [Echinococcus granulosus]
MTLLTYCGVKAQKRSDKCEQRQLSTHPPLHSAACGGEVDFSCDTTLHEADVVIEEWSTSLVKSSFVCMAFSCLIGNYSLEATISLTSVSIIRWPDFTRT